MIAPDQAEVVADFAEFGALAFTTNRSFGSVSTGTAEPVREVMARWDAIRATAATRGVNRLATAAQVHGRHVMVHSPGWEGWLRGIEADGHVAMQKGTAVAVTIADCVPVFIVHPSGAVAVLHSGWRGTAARIVEAGIAEFVGRGHSAVDLRVHLGPAICGNCYVVSAEVARQLLGEPASSPRKVDLRALIAGHASAQGVRDITISKSCTRCHNARFFSHRAGDAGRQVAVILA